MAEEGSELCDSKVELDDNEGEPAGVAFMLGCGDMGLVEDGRELVGDGAELLSDGSDSLLLPDESGLRFAAVYVYTVKSC